MLLVGHSEQARECQAPVTCDLRGLPEIQRDTVLPRLAASDMGILPGPVRWTPVSRSGHA